MSEITWTHFLFNDSHHIAKVIYGQMHCKCEAMVHFALNSYSTAMHLNNTISDGKPQTFGGGAYGFGWEKWGKQFG